MQKALLFLLTLVAAALLVTQASAWWGGPHMTGYGGPAYTANQAPGAANGDIAEIRAEIASLQAKLNRELAQDNVNLNRVRELNRRIGQTQRELRSAASRRGRGYGGGSGHRHGGHRMAGHGPCW